MKGYLPISRKLFEHDLWTEDRQFSKAEAWIDLLAMARYDTDQGSKLIGNKIVKWDRGQLVASTRFLQKRWGWGSTAKVKRFMDLLKNETMITTETKQGQTVVTICKYDDYNKAPEGSETPSKRKTKQDRNAIETPSKQDRNETNKDNKGNKENNSPGFFDFENFWRLYGIDEGRQRCEVEYMHLSDEDRQAIARTLPAYIESTPEVKYRKSPRNYLKEKKWNDAPRQQVVLSKKSKSNLYPHD